MVYYLDFRIINTDNFFFSNHEFLVDNFLVKTLVIGIVKIREKRFTKITKKREREKTQEKHLSFLDWSGKILS